MVHALLLSELHSSQAACWVSVCASSVSFLVLLPFGKLYMSIWSSMPIPVSADRKASACIERHAHTFMTCMPMLNSSSSVALGLCFRIFSQHDCNTATLASSGASAQRNLSVLGDQVEQASRTFVLCTSLKVSKLVLLHTVQTMLRSLQHTQLASQFVRLRCCQQLSVKFSSGNSL